MVGVPLGQVAELLGQVETVADVFRRDEVFGDLDAVVEISHLVAGSGRNKNGVAGALDDGVPYRKRFKSSLYSLSNYHEVEISSSKMTLYSGSYY